MFCSNIFIHHYFNTFDLFLRVFSFSIYQCQYQSDRAGGKKKIIFVRGSYFNSLNYAQIHAFSFLPLSLFHVDKASKISGNGDEQKNQQMNGKKNNEEE